MLLSGVIEELGCLGCERTIGLDDSGLADMAAPSGTFAFGDGETSLLEGTGFDEGNTSSLLGGGVGWDEEASGRFERRRRPRSWMADAGRERLDDCSRPVLSVVAGGGVAGGAVVSGPGGGGIFVCEVEIFDDVSFTVISGGFKIDEALASALAFSAASRSAFCCRRILSTNW